MILVGVVLFFLPLPPTSLVGIVLILVGVALWLVDYFGGGTPTATDGGREE